MFEVVQRAVHVLFSKDTPCLSSELVCASVCVQYVRAV